MTKYTKKLKKQKLNAKTLSQESVVRNLEEWSMTIINHKNQNNCKNYRR